MHDEKICDQRVRDEKILDERINDIQFPVNGQKIFESGEIYIEETFLD